jgi:2-methylaconitate cis-trans-isomerase PrpF
VNTKKAIIAELPVKDGLYNDEGDFAIAGVPGTGGCITLQFLDPGGSVSGKLLPTGNVKDDLEVPGIGKVNVSIVDAANPVVFVQAKALGLKGTEIYDIDNRVEVREALEAIRSRAAVLLGLASSPEEAGQISQDVPKVAFVSEARDYETVSGKLIRSSDIEIVARIMSMGTLHKAYAVTGAICTAGAAKIEGSVVQEILADDASDKDEIRLGHPGGVIPVGVEMEKDHNSYRYRKALVYRTARRLMDGQVYVPERHFTQRG